MPNVKALVLESPNSETSSTVSIVKEITPEAGTQTHGYRLVIVMAVMVMAAFMVRPPATQCSDLLIILTGGLRWFNHG